LVLGFSRGRAPAACCAINDACTAFGVGGTGVGPKADTTDVIGARGVDSCENRSI
jgi:hypothetical protein